jgi:hypothetical protein
VPMNFEIVPKNYGYFKKYNVKEMLWYRCISTSFFMCLHTIKKGYTIFTMSKYVYKIKCLQ